MPHAFRAIVFFKIACVIFLCAAALPARSQNFTGSWDGRFEFFSWAKLDCQLSVFYDSSRQQYYGVFYTQSKNKKVTSSRPNVVYFVGRQMGDSLQLVEIAAPKPENNVIPNSTTNYYYSDGWAFVNFYLTATTTNTGKALTGYFQSDGVTKFPIHLTASATVAEAYKEQALQTIQGLSIADFSYAGAGGTGIVQENALGTFTYTIFNRSNAIYKNIKTDLIFLNDAGKSMYYSMYDNTTTHLASAHKSLFPGNSQKVTVLVNSKLNVPVDSLINVVEVSPWKGNSFLSYRKAVPTDGFMKTTTINSEVNWHSERLKLIGSFYGINAYQYNIKSSLQKLTASGDKLAQVWEAYFTYFGLAGFETDEQMAFYIARRHNAFSDVCDMAAKGDVEAMFLAAVGYKMRLMGINTKEMGDDLLDKAAKNNFTPAVYTFGLKRLFEKKKNDAKYNLQKALTAGATGATFQLALQYDSVAVALPKFEKLAAAGNPDAMLKLSDMYETGKGVAKNTSKAIEYAKAAAAISSNGKTALANLYLDNDATINEGIKLKEQAAQLGSRDAMFDLAVLYLYGKNKVAQNAAAGIAFLKKAAEHGQPQAMNLLGALYFEGKAIAKNDFLSRYWINQAFAKGVGEKATNATNSSNAKLMVDFLDGVLNYRPSIYYEVTNGYGNIVNSGYADDKPLDYILWGGIANVLVQSRQQRQEIVDDIRLIYTRDNITTYGGLLSSVAKAPFVVKRAMIVDTYAEGKVNFGTFAGSADPDGFSFGKDLTHFSIRSDFPHGAVMFGLDGYNWAFAGKSNTGTTGVQGNLLLRINDRDYINNFGYFDVRIDVFSSE